MNGLGSRYRLGTWRRGAPVRGTIAQYVVLSALAPSALSGHFGSVRTNLMLCLVAAVWSLMALHPALRRRAPVMAVFVAGVGAISFVLVIRGLSGSPMWSGSRTNRALHKGAGCRGTLGNVRYF